MPSWELYRPKNSRIKDGLIASEEQIFRRAVTYVSIIDNGKVL